MSLNIQNTIGDHEGELFWELLKYEKPDVFCVCETWLNSNILNNEILPPTCKFIDVISAMHMMEL